MRLVVLARARADLRATRRYIVERSGNAEVARAFVERLAAHCERLASLPGVLGRARPDLGPELRSSPAHGYVVVFRYAPGRLEIVRVIHGARDIGARFEA